MIHSCEIFTHGETPAKISPAEYLFLLHHYKARFSIMLGEYELLPKLIKLMKGYFHELEEQTKINEKVTNVEEASFSGFDPKTSIILYNWIANKFKSLKSEIVQEFN